jgi:hypothetical protein
MKSNAFGNRLATRTTYQNQVWGLDVIKLDIPGRPRIVLVTNVHTRKPLMTTVISEIADNMIAALAKAASQGPPKEIWIDGGRWPPALQAWAAQHDVPIYHRWPYAKAERLVNDLNIFLGGLLQSKSELSRHLEAWRHAYDKK